MFSKILDILRGFAVALGWAKQKSDQADGAKILRANDEAAAIKDATDVQKADSIDGAGGVDPIRQRLLDESRP